MKDLLPNSKESTPDEPVVEYKVVENESTSLDEVFNYLFEKVQKEEEMT